MLKNRKTNTALAAEIRECIQLALAEDIGTGDVTTDSIVPAHATLRGRIVAKQNGVVAGLQIAEAVWRELDERVIFTPQVADGAKVEAKTVIAEVVGPARALLTGERTALNFLGRMSGIATLTRQFVDAVASTRAVILDTRKTAPGMRLTDKLAVWYGGGKNHRTGLFDLILIKDNHIDFAGSITAAVTSVRRSVTNLPIEVEARTLEDVREALALKVEYILLDNMSLELMQEAVRICGARVKLEASGNVSLENVLEVARTGVDQISVGALTHSPKVFDLSLEFVDRNDRNEY